MHRADGPGRSQGRPWARRAAALVACASRAFLFTSTMAEATPVSANGLQGTSAPNIFNSSRGLVATVQVMCRLHLCQHFLSSASEETGGLQDLRVLLSCQTQDIDRSRISH